MWGQSAYEMSASASVAFLAMRDSATDSSAFFELGCACLGSLLRLKVEWYCTAAVEVHEFD